jgi:hypothetical protein
MVIARIEHKPERLCVGDEFQEVGYLCGPKGPQISKTSQGSFTFDPWARFGPMLQSFLTTTHHPRQKPWRTSHTNNKYHRPNANLMYERASHHAHSGSSHPPTSDGHNPHHQHAGHSLITHTQHPHQASILSNSSDLAYPKHTAHYYVTPPVRSNSIPQPLHLTFTHSSLWKIHPP